jgi:CrcB protein
MAALRNPDASIGADGPTDVQELSAVPTGVTQGLVHRTSVGSALASHRTIDDVESLASIDQPPESHLQPSKVYRPFSVHVLALLAPASILGVLGRLGLQALMHYDGQSIFPLAYVQAIGCLFMGLGLGLKLPLGQL